MSLEPRFHVHINHSEILLSVKTVLMFLLNTVLGHGLLCLPHRHIPRREKLLGETPRMMLPLASWTFQSSERPGRLGWPHNLSACMAGIL